MDQQSEIIHPEQKDKKPHSLARHVSNREIRQIFEGGNDANPLEEMQVILAAIIPDCPENFLVRIHQDMNGIFAGQLRGFRESQVKYHDLRHTRNVALASLRLFHGLHCDGINLPPDVILLGIICAYFHDTGMLLTVRDSAPSGAAYLKNHEERSISFIRQYLHDHGYPSAYIDNCASIINCTNLTTAPGNLIFESEEIEIAGNVLGTADILAQMADRYYLESLPLLYMEQQDAGIQQHRSSLALMRQTTAFYHEVIERRLFHDFKKTCRFMRTHFRERWQLDRDLYMDFIEKNIKYLEDVLRWHDNGEGDLKLYLRRHQPKI
ncbi:hypothetical protein [Desulfopila aestuarii]|uniref:HD/PDEase domain-containing protein n=1 Tax=Desulfopila aestuarii DSM 18488 TaxID=1121416 RepID=A0A1M7YCP4_9BACT|nr:hypothetical protein [Desulfopila aestuarii]SHO50410.1 hypothetical protein SAMN02745220_03413 [Desulfopila aestuarii DSM 18488]